MNDILINKIQYFLIKKMRKMVYIEMLLKINDLNRRKNIKNQSVKKKDKRSNVFKK
jgi:hypothetical protein